MHLIPRNLFLGDFFDDNFFDVAEKDSLDIKTDIYEEDGNYIIEMDVPGFDKKDVNITYDKGYLNFSAKKSESKEEKKKNYLRKERFEGLYQRSFYVGEIDESSIKANFENGILKVTLPKKQLETNHKKTIMIE